MALIIETLTDNRNRTAAEVRAAFAKHGGALGETGSVSFLFDRVGGIHFDSGTAAEDAATLCGVFVETDDATGLAKSVSPIRLGGRLREVWPG